MAAAAAAAAAAARPVRRAAGQAGWGAAAAVTVVFIHSFSLPYVKYYFRLDLICYFIDYSTVITYF